MLQLLQQGMLQTMLIPAQLKPNRRAHCWQVLACSFIAAEDDDATVSGVGAFIKLSCGIGVDHAAALLILPAWLTLVGQALAGGAISHLCFFWAACVHRLICCIRSGTAQCGMFNGPKAQDAVCMQASLMPWAGHTAPCSGNWFTGHTTLSWSCECLW